MASWRTPHFWMNFHLEWIFPWFSHSFLYENHHLDVGFSLSCALEKLVKNFMAWPAWGLA
jgi:hypothetical protein